MSCSVTLNGRPSTALGSNNPEDPTVTCFFYDLTWEDGNVAAVANIPVGQTIGVSPVTYPPGTRLRIETVLQSTKTDPEYVKQVQEVTVSSNTIVSSDIPYTLKGAQDNGNVDPEGVDPNDPNAGSG